MPSSDAATRSSSPAGTGRSRGCRRWRPVSSSAGRYLACARRPALDAARELVVDRAGDTRVLLERDAAAHDGDLRSDGALARQLDGERVQRDDADRAAPLLADVALGAPEVPAE